MNILKSIKIVLILFLFSLILYSCTSSISTFNQYAYIQDTSLKVESLYLMDKAIDTFSLHLSEVKDMRLKIDKAYEFEKSRPNNSITTQIWEKIKNPDGNLFGGFLVYWQQQGVLSPIFVQDKKKQIGLAFDQIIELESKKIKEQ